MSSPRHIIKQHPERACPDEAITILSEGYLAHVGYTEAEQAYIIPFAYHFDPAQPDVIYLHGSRGSHTLKYLAQGHSLCIEITQLDGLVYSRSAMYHSMNYRSVVCFGRGHEIQDEAEKARLFDEMIQRYHPQRMVGEDYEAASEAQLKGTRVIAVNIEQISAKQRQGGPRGPIDDDIWAPGQASVVPLEPRQDQWRPYVWTQAPFQLSSDNSRIPRDQLYDLLKSAYWNERLTPEGLERRLQHSLCFGLYHEHDLIGFARLVTDHDSFAYLADVIVAKAWQAQGLGTWLMACVMEHPVMRQIRWCLLSTRYAHGLYRKAGFEPHSEPERLMIYVPESI